MTATTEEERVRRSWQPAVLTYAFRPMFLAAGSWAIVAIAIWLAMFLGYLRLPTRFDPLTWHIHEMLFGFVMASVAGFLLTAIPNQRYFRWTGEQKSKLIESILIGLPLPSFFMAQDDSGNWEVVDGMQRLSTILDFMGELGGKKL